jgi:hypothetical protein
LPKWRFLRRIVDAKPQIGAANGVIGDETNELGPVGQGSDCRIDRETHHCSDLIRRRAR